jgi:hypothetical protein
VHERFEPELSKANVGIDDRLAALCDHVGTAELWIPVKPREVASDRANTISGLRRRAYPAFEYQSITVPALTIDVALGSAGTAVRGMDSRGRVAKRNSCRWPRFL